MDEAGAPATAETRFRYRAQEAVTGIVRTGELSGTSAFEIRGALRRIGLQPLTVEPVRNTRVPAWFAPVYAAWLSHSRRRRQPVLADICQSLATLLRAGVTLDDALAIIGGSPTRSSAERAFVGRLRDAVRNGTDLSVAAEQEVAWLGPFDTALIAAGQRAGDLPATLQAVATHHRRAGSISQRLFVALAYPGILALAGIGVTIFLGVRVLPQLSALLIQAHQPVPILTSLVMTLGHALLWAWPLVLAMGIALIVGLAAVARRIPAKGVLGAWVHGNLLARLQRRYRAGRLSWSLARLLGAGMTVTDALAVITATIDDRPLQALMLEAQAGITRGEDFSTILARSTLLDPEVAQLIRVGERSGELSQMLEQIAEHAFIAADATMERVTALIGPLAILLLSCLIGILALACVAPISNLGDIL